MSADDVMGSCRHRGEPGHLPHPDGRPCITNDQLTSPASTGEQLEQAAGALLRTERIDAERKALARERDALVDRLKAEQEAHNRTAEAADRLAMRLRDLEAKAKDGMALEVAGRVYVALTHVQDDLARDAQPANCDTATWTTGRPPELLEAQGGVFVPIPAGHMLSVTVTPYSTAEDDDVAHVCSTACGDGRSCPPS